MRNSKNLQTAWIVGLFWSFTVFVLLVATLHLSDFNTDEIITYNVVRENWIKLTSNRINNTHSPLYFWLLKPFAEFSNDPIWIRYVSALLAAGSVGVLAGTIAFSCSRVAAVLLGILFMSSPAFMYIGHLARPYALLMAFTATSLSCAFLLFRQIGDGSKACLAAESRKSRHTWRILQFSMIGAAWTMMAGVFSVIAIFLAPFIIPKIRSEKAFIAFWLRRMIPALIAGAIIGAILLPSMLRRAGTYWAAKSFPLSADTVIDAFAGALVHNIPWVDLRLQSWIQVIVIGAALCLFAIGVLKRNRYPNVFPPAIALAVGLPLALIVISLHTSILVPRYFYLAAPGFLCVMALGGSVLYESRAGAALLFVVAPFFLAQGFSAATWERTSPWGSTAQMMAGLAEKSDAIVVMPPFNIRDLDFYLRAMGNPKSSFELRRGSRRPERLKEKIREMVETRRVVWLVARSRAGHNKLNLSDLSTKEIRFCLIQEGPISISAFYSSSSKLVAHQHCGNRTSYNSDDHLLRKH